MAEANNKPTEAKSEATTPPVGEKKTDVATPAVEDKAPAKVKDCIVVAEDSKPNREIIVQNLKRFGFDVLVFENGKKAWEDMSKSSQPIVGVFSDIMMPEMDGLELLRNVRNSDKFKNLPFVFVSAVMQRDLIIEAKKLGTNGYLLKPITASMLQVKLKELYPDRKLAVG